MVGSISRRSTSPYGDKATPGGIFRRASNSRSSAAGSRCTNPGRARHPVAMWGNPFTGTLWDRRRLTSMSRAFVKETEDVEDLPDRPISDLPNDVTAEGFRRIEEALAAAQAAQAAAQAAGDRDALATARREGEC